MRLTYFVRQAANLWQYKAMLQQKLAEQLGALNDDIHLIWDLLSTLGSMNLENFMLFIFGAGLQ